MSSPTALIVDDEADIRELLEITLQKMEIQTCSAADLAEARTALENQPFDLCLTDMRLPDGDGLSLLQHIQNRYPNLPVAVITAYGSVDGAVRALKAGAFDFVSKPVDLEMLRNLVQTALRISESYPERDRRSRDTLIGDSLTMQKIRATIAKLACNQAPVYISGDSGTGKELVARLIHEKGPRNEAAFVPVNCGAIPAELMESEFFGHKKGSFTGATRDKQGLFQAAHRGTLFLDEVAELPLNMQVKLLRAIQERAVRPIGAQQEESVDARILSATHKNLAQLVQEGSFRQDLYYRINVIQLAVPPLRQRSDDILQLARHILDRLTKQNDGPTLTLDESAIRALRAYTFPGNVRELENILERATALCEGDHIMEADLQLPTDIQPATQIQDQAQADNAEQAVTATASIGNEPLESYLDKVEKDAILEALEQTQNNKTAAAKLLGITFRALRYRLKKLGME